MITIDMLPAFVRSSAHTITPIGSRVTCNPAPTDTDADFLVYIPNKAGVDRLAFALSAADWEDCGKGYEMPGDWNAYRKGELNIILTHDADFCDRFRRAMALAARFNLLDKGDRIALCNAVRDGQGDLLPSFRNDGRADTSETWLIA